MDNALNKKSERKPRSSSSVMKEKEKILCDLLRSRGDQGAGLNDILFSLFGNLPSVPPAIIQNVNRLVRRLKQQGYGIHYSRANNAYILRSEPATAVPLTLVDQFSLELGRAYLASVYGMKKEGLNAKESPDRSCPLVVPRGEKGHLRLSDEDIEKLVESAMNQNIRLSVSTSGNRLLASVADFVFYNIKGTEDMLKVRLRFTEQGKDEEFSLRDIESIKRLEL